MALVIQQHSIAFSSSSSSSSSFVSKIDNLHTKFKSKKKSYSISQPKASWQELAGVLVLSAIPFTGVKAIANSPLGERLQKRLQSQKSASLRLSADRLKLSDLARDQSRWFGKDRPRWLGPVPFEYPSHLSGQLPGDYGFDIAGFAKDPDSLQKYYNFEILHARWAMLGALGALIPEILDLSGAFHFTEPVWWRVGYSKLKGDTLDYLGIPGLHLAGSQGIIVIAICQVLLMVGPEYARYCGIEALEPLGIFLPGDINYPGGILFDPLNLSKDPVAFEELKVKEMKNGRLAMVAWLGFSVQAAVTVSEVTGFRIEKKLMLRVERMSLENRRSQSAEIVKLEIALLTGEPWACAILLAAHTSERVWKIHMDHRMLRVIFVRYAFPHQQMINLWRYREFNYRRGLLR